MTMNIERKAKFYQTLGDIEAEYQDRIVIRPVSKYGSGSELLPYTDPDPYTPRAGSGRSWPESGTRSISRLRQ